MAYYKKNAKKVEKVQSVWRGRKARKLVKKLKQERTLQTEFIHPPAKEIQVVPDYGNENTKATEAKLGPFKFEG